MDILTKEFNGYNGHVRSLVTVNVEWIKPTGFPADKDKVDSQPALRPFRKILVADDNPIIQRTLYFALRDKGYRVLMADNISAALAIVRREKPELILLDINFPPDGGTDGGGERDGFRALDWMQRVNELQGIPVVMISSKGILGTGEK